MIKTLLLFVIAFIITSISYYLISFFSGLPIKFEGYILSLVGVGIILGVILMIDEYLTRNWENPNN